MSRVILAVCIGTFVSVSALAQQSAPPPVILTLQPMTPKATATCKDDITKYCSDVIPGGAGTCLKSHNSDLSEDCQKAMSALPKPRPIDDSGDD